MSKKIKWGCIQPLTGGMYIGALKAIGHHAEWILSYDGLDSVTVKDGKVVYAANEYNLRQWLKNSKDGADVPYYQIKDRAMFADDIHTSDIKIDKGAEENVTPDYSDLDLVIAVPVCSGLSVSTRAGEATKDSRNCNMQWIAHYTLNTIKPKVYCFENAPTLMGAKGEPIRASLEKIAKDAGYSVLYYKTDTLYHHNCQRRPRTFVIFVKWQGEQVEQLPPTFGYEKDTLTIPEFFDAIPNDALQHYPVESFPHNYAALDFYREKFGQKFFDDIKEDFNVITYILNNGYTEEYLKYVSKNYPDDKEKIFKYINHINEKKAQGLNYYAEDAWIFKKYFPSVQFRSIPNMMHYKGGRFCTVREYLALMGMPNDFILYGAKSCLAKIGQNVPVNTAKFIVSQIVNILNNWEYNNREKIGNVIFQNNITEKEVIEIKKESIELF